MVETEGDCFQTSQTVLCIAYLKLMHIILGVCAHFGAEQEQNWGGHVEAGRDARTEFRVLMHWRPSPPTGEKAGVAKLWKSFFFLPEASRYVLKMQKEFKTGATEKIALHAVITEGSIAEARDATSWLPVPYSACCCAREPRELTEPCDVEEIEKTCKKY